MAKKRPNDFLVDRLHKGALTPTPEDLLSPGARPPEAGNFRKLEKAVAISLTLVVVASLNSASVGTGKNIV
jgi:hypothetical protein